MAETPHNHLGCMRTNDYMTMWKVYTTSLLRKMRVLLVMILLTGSVVTACGTSSAHSLSPDEIAKQVGIHYGDSQARVASAKSDVADPPPHEPIYLMSITGHFHKGALTALTLHGGSQPHGCSVRPRREPRASPQALLGA